MVPTILLLLFAAVLFGYYSYVRAATTGPLPLLVALSLLPACIAAWWAVTRLVHAGTVPTLAVAIAAMAVLLPLAFAGKLFARKPVAHAPYPRDCGQYEHECDGCQDEERRK